MPPEIHTLLQTMLTHANDITEATAGMDLNAYCSNKIVQKATFWDFLVIGEAMQRLRNASPEIASLVTGSRSIVSHRNQLIHGYDVIRASITWSVIGDHLPILIRELTALIDDAAN